MSVAAVITGLESAVNNTYKWDVATVPGTLHRWLADGKDVLPPDMTTGGMQCFGLPFRVAYNVGALTYNQASDLYSKFLIECATTGPTTLCPGGLTRAYWTKISCIPLLSKAGTASFPRGDVVLFSTKTIKYNAHFAVATGNGTDMVSFGHGGGLKAASLRVEILDLDEMYTTYQKLFTECHYGTPAW
jgi:hypothetical protein